MTYRIQQGVRALTGFTQSVDYDLAAQYLTSPQLALFRRIHHSEQLHSLNVLRSVLAQGRTPHDLAVAALLHDVGKSRYHVQVWQKTLPVVVKALSPRLYKAFCHRDVEHWLYRPFVIKQQHPVWSVEMVQNLGLTECAQWLIRHHQEDRTQWQDHPFYELLRRLQIADDAN